MNKEYCPYCGRELDQNEHPQDQYRILIYHKGHSIGADHIYSKEYRRNRISGELELYRDAYYNGGKSGIFNFHDKNETHFNFDGKSITMPLDVWNSIENRFTNIPDAIEKAKKLTLLK